MKKTEFVSKLAEFCEFDKEDLTPETKLTSIEDYDSMALLSIMAFVDKNFKVKLTSSQLQNLTDFNSIISYIGNEKFQDDYS
jgi:acyl carrier protein